ncbi:MAG: hypothetical protein J6B04_03595, partial [Clostridia bacterium]|nr:hypothetical protein [Clostridia bacterium]
MNVNKIIRLERENLSPTEKALFCEDFKRVIDEHFERDGELGVDVTETEDGFSVCVIFGARRIK